MRKTLIAAAMASTLAVPGLATAQQPAPPAQSADAKDEGLKLGIFDVTGYIDASYNNLSRRALFTSGTPSRVFDIERSGFALRQAAVKLDYSPQQGLGGVLNLTAGKDADVIAAYKTDPSNGRGCNVVTGLNADGTSCDRDRFDVTQAYLQYKAGSWHLMAGKFVTLAGAEVIWSPANPNFSRSILFGYAIPFTHTGLRAHYSLSDTLTLQIGANQGWDDIKDTNSSKGYELGLMFNPSKMVALTAMFHGGKERVGGLVNTGAEGDRNLFDTVLTINATDKLSFVLNYDYGTQDGTAGLIPSGASKAVWSGIAGYANYQFTDQWKLSFRAELFDDKDGYRTGVVQKWKEATLTLAWLPTKPIELRAEVRRDRSNVASFLDRDGVTGRTNNASYGVQFLYKF
ncbi:MAG: outer membrane beta-barrel protein [Burkholderiales bacterium]